MFAATCHPIDTQLASHNLLVGSITLIGPGVFVQRTAMRGTRRWLRFSLGEYGWNISCYSAREAAVRGEYSDTAGGLRFQYGGPSVWGE